METVVTLFDVGESPDDIQVHHVEDAVHIYIRKGEIGGTSVYRHAATITGVNTQTLL